MWLSTLDSLPARRVQMLVVAQEATRVGYANMVDCAVTVGNVNGDSHWVRWHELYDEPGSALPRRLRRIQARVIETLDSRPDGPIRVLSMCAGQGRDLIGPLATHPRRDDVRALLVELDPDNAETARRAAAAAGLSGVEVLRADAALPSVYTPVVPVDLALVCGVFGNISDDDIRRTIEYLPSMLRSEGRVIWTRHREEPDRTPTIRDWFSACGFTEVAFDSEPGYFYGVGTHLLATEVAKPAEPGAKLFTFFGDGARAQL